MDDIHKLKHMIEHWAEHNTEHAATYSSWAGRAEAVGKKELAAVLRQIAEETGKLDALFRKAGELI